MAIGVEENIDIFLKIIKLAIFCFASNSSQPRIHLVSIDRSNGLLIEIYLVILDTGPLFCGECSYFCNVLNLWIIFVNEKSFI